MSTTDQEKPIDRATMNGKSVLYREARTVLTLNAEGFREKLLCDGITLNLGDACAYSCAYCYVPAVARKLVHKVVGDTPHSEVVVRRRNAVELLQKQLQKNGQPKYSDPEDNRVVYSSTLVDVAANMELLRETAEACNVIFQNTAWQVRLLTKSNLLPKLVELIPEAYHQRLILGVSTGTLDDRVAKAVEQGTALASKRIESLHWLQDQGFRTFGMICPSLPQKDYEAFAMEMAEAIRVDRCEHIWAEVINVRGESFTHTHNALLAADLGEEAERLAMVSNDKQAWEVYARATFEAHTRHIPGEKLRFLQYVDAKDLAYWTEARTRGAVLLGSKASLAETPIEPPRPLRGYATKPIPLVLDDLAGWMAYVDTLTWTKGHLDESSWLSSLRARSFYISAEIAIAEIQRRCTAAGDAPSEYKLRTQFRRATQGVQDMGPDAFLIPKAPTPAFDLAILKKIAEKAPYASEAWLTKLSSTPVATTTAASFLEALYRPGERIVVFTDFRTQGQAVYEIDHSTVDDLPQGSAEGVWFLTNPVDGKDHTTEEGMPSRRSKEAVTSWRYLVLECDQERNYPGTNVLWLAALVQLPLRIAAIYTSGGKSIHALVRLDASSKEEWDRMRTAIKQTVVRLGADPQAMTAVRLSRLPQTLRGESQQRLLYLNPNPNAAPIVTL